MTPDPNNGWAAHVHRLIEFHRDVVRGSIPPEEARIRLEKLKTEQQAFAESSSEHRRRFNQAYDIVQRRIGEEESMRQLRRRPYNIVYRSQHVLDFKCQCKACVRKHTITMEDRNLLHEMGITWNKAEADEMDGTVVDPSPSSQTQV